jgi:hypothetical protein
VAVNYILFELLLSPHSLLFPAAIVLVKYILFILLICFNYLQLSANPMPFFRNGIKRLDFQNKSERPKFQHFILWQKTPRFCYSIVTKSLHSLLVFAKEGVLLEFYEVKHCKPRKHRYIFVTFLGGLYHGGGQKKEWERWQVQDLPLFCHTSIP